METSVHAGRAKVRIDHLISVIRRILFPHAPAVREKEILTSVLILETRVRDRRNVVPYNVDETHVEKLKKYFKMVVD